MHVGGGDLVSFLQQRAGIRVRGAQELDVRQWHFVLLAQEAFRASDEVPAAPDGAPVPTRIAEDPPRGPRLDIVQVAEHCGLALFYAPSMRNGNEARTPCPRRPGQRDPLDPSAYRTGGDRAAARSPAACYGGGHRRGPGVGRLDSAWRAFTTTWPATILRVLGTGGSMRVRQNDGLTEALDSLDPERAFPTVVARRSQHVVRTGNRGTADAGDLPRLTITGQREDPG